jgi:glycosyltransferase involved in cell wall biosynthesis
VSRWIIEQRLLRLAARKFRGLFANGISLNGMSTIANQSAACAPAISIAKKRPIYFVAHRYVHHAGPSGYDQFASRLGIRVDPSGALRLAGETILRLPTKLISIYNQSHQYSRHDCVREIAVFGHMLRHRNSIYHVLYAEKSLRYLKMMEGKRRNRIVASFHHSAPEYPDLFKSTSHFRGIAHAVVVSRIQIPFMESIVGEGLVSFVPYGVDTNYFRPGTDSVPRRPRCVCVGSHLRDFRNLPAIIDGMRERVPDLEFVLIGARPRLKDRLMRPGVVWKQAIPDQEYLEILQNSDLMVLPLVDSTAVTSVNEALACGLPIITNYGGVSDYLDESCSIQLPVGAVDDMIDAGVGLLGSEVERARMSGAARARALSIDWSETAPKMAAVYEKLSY